MMKNKKANCAKGKRVMSIQITEEDYAALQRIARQDYDDLVAPARLAGLAFEQGLKGMLRTLDATRARR